MRLLNIVFKMHVKIINFLVESFDYETSEAVTSIGSAICGRVADDAAKRRSLPTRPRALIDGQEQKMKCFDAAAPETKPINQVARRHGRKAPSARFAPAAVLVDDDDAR